MTREEKFYISIGQSIENAEQSQMFGKSCFKINKKAFICFFQNEMVFKLAGEYHSEALSLDGSKLFDPSGKNRPMKEWIQVPFDYTESWNEYAKYAMQYVSSK